MSSDTRGVSAHYAELDIVDHAAQVLGDRLAAIILTGQRDAQGEILALAYRFGKTPLIRLRDAIEVALALLEVEDRETVQAWFVGRNEYLGDRAPALVMSENPEAVHAAARQFLAYG